MPCRLHPELLLRRQSGRLQRVVHLGAAALGYLGPGLDVKRSARPKNGVITQNNGVIDPFLQGRGDSR